jgi:hypothetical protein
VLDYGNAAGELSKLFLEFFSIVKWSLIWLLPPYTKTVGQTDHRGIVIFGDAAGVDH